MTGLVYRRISSTASSVISRVSTTVAHWSGWSMKPIRPSEMALRVVSLPATSSKVKKRSRSRSVSSVTVPSSSVTVADVRTVHRSSSGSARFWSVSPWAYMAISTMAVS